MMLHFTYRAKTNRCILLLVILIFAEPILAERWKSDITTSQFKHWFPQFGFIFDRAVKENCAAEYEDYLTKIKNTSKIDWYGGGDVPSALTQPVVSCVLDNTTDYIKSSSEPFNFGPSHMWTSLGIGRASHSLPYFILSTGTQ